MASTVIRISPSLMGRSALEFRELGALLADQQHRVRSAWANLDIEAQAATNLGGYVWQAEQAAYTLAQLTTAMGDQLNTISREFQELDETCRSNLSAIDARYDALRKSWLSTPIGRALEVQRMSREISRIFEGMGEASRKVEEKGWRGKLADAAGDFAGGARDISGSVVGGTVNTAQGAWNLRDEAWELTKAHVETTAMIVNPDLLDPDSRTAKVAFTKGLVKGGWNTVVGTAKVGKWVALSSADGIPGVDLGYTDRNTDFVINVLSNPKASATAVKKGVVSSVQGTYRRYMDGDLETRAGMTGTAAFELVPGPWKVEKLSKAGRAIDPPSGGAARLLDDAGAQGTLFDMAPEPLNVDTFNGRLFDAGPPVSPAPGVSFGQGQLLNPSDFSGGPARRRLDPIEIQARDHITHLSGTVQGTRVGLPVTTLPVNGQVSMTDVIAIIPKDTTRMSGGMPAISTPLFRPTGTIADGYKWDFVDASNQRTRIKIHSTDWNMGGDITPDSNTRFGYTAQISVKNRYLTTDGTLISWPKKPKPGSPDFDARMQEYNDKMNSTHIPVQP